MRNGQDICVDAPITGELFYKLSEYLIPSLADNSTVLYKSKITCPLATAVENAGAVGTGLSCGVDSFYCVCKQLGSEVGSLRLTHLCLFYYLPHNAHFDRMIGELEYGRAKKVAGELGLPLLYCDSNCQEIFDYPDFVNSYHTYYSSFVILCLQKLFGAYFYASDGHTFSNFDIRNTAFEMEPSSQTDCGCYDLLALQAFSTDRLHFYSGGGALTRTEKTRFISEFPIVQRNLFVCNDQGTNCSVCEKCKRTMLDLSAMGRLANFKSVFNVGYFESHKEEYYAWLFCRHCKNEAYIEEPWKMYKDEPLMQEVIRKDTFWKNFSYMRGIYDDKWTRKGLFTKVLRPKGTEKMTVELYFPENMGDNGVKILLNGKNSAQSDNYTSVEGGLVFASNSAHEDRRNGLGILYGYTAFKGDLPERKRSRSGFEGAGLRVSCNHF